MANVNWKMENDCALEFRSSAQCFYLTLDASGHARASPARELSNAVCRGVPAFNLDDAFDASQSADHALQMLQIIDINGEVDSSGSVVQSLIICARVADVGF